MLTPEARANNAIMNVTPPPSRYFCRLLTWLGGNVIRGEGLGISPCYYERDPPPLPLLL